MRVGQLLFCIPRPRLREATTMASSLHRLLLLLPCLFSVAVFCCTGWAEAGRLRVQQASAAPAPQPKPQPGTAAPDQYLTGQNQARAEVRVAPLRWSPALEAEAHRVVQSQRAANNGCQFADLSSSRYGANQAWASYPVSTAEAVRSWVAEGKFYDYGNNSCAPAHQCGTYTQVVWRNTAEVGCAQAICAAEGGAAAAGPSLTLCLYDPPGNIVGQKPY